MTATAMLGSAEPLAPGSFGLRVLPAPRSEPPTDEEREIAGFDSPPPAAMALPFELAGTEPARYRSANGPGAVTVARTASRTVRAPDAGDTGSANLADLQRTVPLDVEATPVRTATRRFLATCVEVIGGYRPMAQLRPLCLPSSFADIGERLSNHPSTGPAWRSKGLAHLGARGPSALGRPGVAAPPRTGRVHQTGPADRIVIRRVQICETIDGVAEIAVVLARRDQVWAMALRIERRRGRWLCSHLEVI
jgi:hypothetical protein